MPRNMSFSLTKEQFINRTKTVTRRANWDHLTPGDLVMGVEKCMGLKKGEKIKRLGLIRIVSVQREQLNTITEEEVAEEGFPGWTASQFVRMFLRLTGGTQYQYVNRIEFEYVE